MVLAVAAILLLVIGGVFLLWQGRRLRLGTGVPAGEVIYADTGAWSRTEAPLVSRRFGLVGKPDYLVQISEGKRTVTVPVEVKSRGRPDEPYDSHVLQLAAYCLLVEDVHQRRPPYGLLHYADATLRIPFTDELRRQVLDSADAIRRARAAADVHRQHADPQRCQNCGYRHACGEEV
jgi:CRISPR-associated exonuclease Cas4